MVSPLKTNRNAEGPGEPPAKYHCLSRFTPTTGPWERTSSWSLGSIAWSGGGSAGDFNSGNSAGWTVRGLKSVADDMVAGIYSADDSGKNAEASITKSGSSAEHALLQPLFGTIGTFGSASDPGPLGATKEEFFGLPSWKIKMLQCGGPPFK
jgi:hypothetical protein